MPEKEIDVQKELKERFGELPKAVQNAITSADVEKHLRDLADSHKLHLDQWQTLENQVMLALLGFIKVEDLADQIREEVGVSSEMAVALAADISKVVFEPIRGELERKLDHPEAKQEVPSEIEEARQAVLEEAKSATQTAPAVAAVEPATPPAPAPTIKVERAAVSPSYISSTPSHERRTVDGDPYREQVA